MLQIALTAAAWYAFPKSIEYITARPHALESKVDRLRGKLFSCRVACEEFGNTNRLTRSISNAIYLSSSHMWLAALIVPGLIKLLPFTSFLRKPMYIFVCYALYYGKEISEEKLREFINSTQILHLMANPVAFRVICSEIGLRLINRYTQGVLQNLELLDILNQGLDYETTRRLLITQPIEGSSVLEKVTSFREAQEHFSEYLRRGPSKPSELPDYSEDIHDTDPILSKIRCPILGRPVRSLIQDPTNPKIIYDQESFRVYLESYNISPITRKKIPTNFSPFSEGGSKYDSIIRYRKACLGLRSLGDQREFIEGIRHYCFFADKENPRVFAFKMFLFNLRACLALSGLEDKEAFISKIKRGCRSEDSLGEFILNIFIANLGSVHSSLQEKSNGKDLLKNIFIPNVEKAYSQLEVQDPRLFMINKVIPCLQKICSELEQMDERPLMAGRLSRKAKYYIEAQLKQGEDLKELSSLKKLIFSMAQAVLQLEHKQDIRELISSEAIPLLKAYAKFYKLYDVKQFIGQEVMDRLKIYLRLQELEDAEKFILHLKEVFAEICTLENVEEVKSASEKVRDFFQEGFFAAYDVSKILEDREERDLEIKHGEEVREQSIEEERQEERKSGFYKSVHRDHLFKSNMESIFSFGPKEFVGVSIDDFEEYPFIENELELEIQMIKHEGSELIQEFL